MKQTYRTWDIARRFNHLFDVISSPRFLARQGLGNEVPFFIASMPIRQGLEVDEQVRMLQTKLAKSQVKAVIVNLYDACLEILRDQNVLDELLAQEPEFNKQEIKDTLQSLLNPNTTLADAIEEQVNGEDCQVVFITGIGEVYPYIRTHAVLNNLQSRIEDKPTVFFFPGDYNFSSEFGSSLDLFNDKPGDKYYRAFNIYDYTI